MLIKPNNKKTVEVKTQKIRQSKKQCVCNKCHSMQTYYEINVPIQYGFNSKQSVLIEGIERVCSVCGWHVDDIETTRINHDIAVSLLNGETNGK